MKNYNVKKYIMFCILFTSLQSFATELGEFFNTSVLYAAKAIKATEESILDTVFWKKSLIAGALLSAKIENEKIKFNFNNATLKTSLCCGFIGTFFEKFLPTETKENSFIHTACNNSIFSGIFLETGFSALRTLWNREMQDKYKLFLLGLSGSYLAVKWADKYLKNNSEPYRSAQSEKSLI